MYTCIIDELKTRKRIYYVDSFTKYSPIFKILHFKVLTDLRANQISFRPTLPQTVNILQPFVWWVRCCIYDPDLTDKGKERLHTKRLQGIVRITQFYLHILRFIRKRNELYLPLPSQPQLVLVY